MLIILLSPVTWAVIVYAIYRVANSLMGAALRKPLALEAAE